MELSAFAEQVLFATSLEEKLRCPAAITDEQPGSALVAPAAPGRPVELRFKAQGGETAAFPGLHQLDSERERGRLLHFFANHELLATELMALVLLRFPEAPAAFRRGVLQTLRDEQEHTRLYVERMRACGLHFGELPVSGYFWRVVSAMENPMDYVSSLSLTFEQANLDFARHFAGCFAAAGDAETAALLEKIYRDEIGHVAYGLKWFRRWKNPNESDWEAFCRQLKFPLSPQRAKGFSLNVEGRRAAGFDPGFIAELDVYAQSKGRTPSVLDFNPFAEGFMAWGRGFTPVRAQTRLAQDLATLPQFLGRQDDIVLVPERPAVEFLSGLKQAGFALPEFVELKRLPELQPRKLGRLRPWAWGPDSAELLRPLFGSVTGEARTEAQCFNPGIAQLYGKAWSVSLLRGFLAESESKDQLWLCAESVVGQAAGDLATTLDLVAAIRGRGHHRVVIKESLGLAGRNAIRLWEPAILDAQRSWMERALGQGRQLVVEPWLERVRDLSVQLEMTSQGLKLCGYTGLVNDPKGQFHGNWASPNLSRPPATLARLFPQADIVPRIQRLYVELMTRLEAELRQVDYLGPVGIDAFVYRAEDGQCRLKPIVEINPRYTMGRLTLELMKHATPGGFGLFRLINRARLHEAGHAQFADFARWFAKVFPLQVQGDPHARIHSGGLCLTDPVRAQESLAVFQVVRSWEELHQLETGESPH